VTTQNSRPSRWYAVYCQPHRESAAAAHLKNQDFTVFLPKREKVRRHARKIEKVRRPFFPGYLFVGLDIERERWRNINSTVGVIRIILQNERPAPVPVGIVEALMAASDGDDVLQIRMVLNVGQKVRVIGGPLADFIGELDQLTDSDRVRVLLDVMGGRTRVVLPRDYLVPAET
jgi:transcription elongation factor/antiterminator RfaH